MSRAKSNEVSSPISLFPFIGVLLSTMGALLVVLIAVSRSAHDAAVRELEVKKAAAAAANQQSDRDKLDEVNQYVAKLNKVRTEAQQRLRDDQLRLSHIEDHTRRLKEKLDGLQLSVNELVALESDHYDDHKQAEREVERLGQLIESTRETIASLKEEQKSKKRSYAIIPYEGPHGTRRRPIYIECRSEEVVLQPEGIRLTPEDFRPPLGAGNPLATALRATREYIIRQEGVVDPQRETRPYPLILVRPEGIMAYYRVRQAIESWDTDFGYELVDSDWKLEFPTPNPVLADLVLQAVEHSRTRQQMLVAAAPGRFGRRHVSGGGGSFDDDADVYEDEVAGGGQFSDERGGGRFSGGGPGGGYGGGYRDGYGSDSRGPHASDASPHGEHGEFFASAELQRDNAGNGPRGSSGVRSGPGEELADGVVGAPGGGTGGGGVPGGPAASGTFVPGGTAGGGGTGAGGSGMPSMSSQQSGASFSVGTGTADADAAGPHGAPPPLSASATGSSVANGVGEAPFASLDRSTGGPNIRLPGAGSRSSNDEPAERVPLDMQMNVKQRIPAHTRGQNWAIRGKGPTSVPVRRAIRVAVHADRIALQPDSPESTARRDSSSEITLNGPTVAKLDDFVRAVQDRVHEWGLAGTSMYWRPVLVLEVAPDGQARAYDLARLLENSGIEVRSEATAARPAEGGPSATR
jgi:hypothetical protein